MLENERKNEYVGSEEDTLRKRLRLNHSLDKKTRVSQELLCSHPEELKLVIDG